MCDYFDFTLSVEFHHCCILTFIPYSPDTDVVAK